MIFTPEQVLGKTYKELKAHIQIKDFEESFIEKLDENNEIFYHATLTNAHFNLYEITGDKVLLSFFGNKLRQIQVWFSEFQLLQLLGKLQNDDEANVSWISKEKLKEAETNPPSKTQESEFSKSEFRYLESIKTKDIDVAELFNFAIISAKLPTFVLMINLEKNYPFEEKYFQIEIWK